MKIKIAFIIDKITRELGGTEKQLLLLLKKLDKNRFDPSLCVLRDSEWLRQNDLGVDIRFFHIESVFSIRSQINLFKLAGFLRRGKYHIVQTFFRDGNIIGSIAALLAGRKILISSRRNMGFWHNKKEIFVLKMLNHWTTSFLANSEAIKKYTQQMENVPADKIDVIYNGIENSNGRSDNGDEFKSVFAKDRIRIISVANLRDLKRFDTFLKAAEIVLGQYSDVDFIVAGDGPEKTRYLELAEDLEIAKNVKFLGHRNDIPTLLEHCHIGVLCSETEGFSNSIMEYMQAGLPVVCTNTGGNTELVEEQKNGLLFAPGDFKTLAGKLLYLLNNPAIARKMGVASHQIIHAKFSLSHYIKTTEKYYNQQYAEQFTT